MNTTGNVELIALPLSGEQFSMHFGRCDGLLLAHWHRQSGQVCDIRKVIRRQIGCETMPHWLKALAVQRVVVGGIGIGAQQHLQQMGVAINSGYNGTDPLQVLKDFQARPDHQGPNPCADDLDHHHHHCRT